MVCLVGAVLAFSAGLVGWTIAANLALAVRICAASMTGATFIVLLVIVGWEAREWWHSESRKVEQAPAGTEPSAEKQSLRDLRQAWKQSKEGTPKKTVGYRQMLVNGITRYFGPGADRSISNLPQESSTQNPGKPSSGILGPLADRFGGRASVRRNSSALGLLEGGDDYDIPDLELPMLPVIGKVSPARGKFHGAVYRLIVDPRLRDQVRAQSKESPKFEHTSSKTSEPQCIRPDELLNLKPSHRLPVFHPTGHDIQFSPDRTRLAVSKLNGTVAIWAVGKFDEKPEVVIPCPIGRFVWSPDSSQLLIVKKNGLFVQDVKSSEALNPLRDITDTIGPAVWLQSLPSFVVEINRKLRIFNTHSGSEIDGYELHRSPLHALDIASVPLAHPSGTTSYG
ncbi:hypothetical protein FRC05_007687 [Tulasnella sp. 425]|nr:hypothetical protein FRC05_007687 [Tulasnella sp. 425]